MSYCSDIINNTSSKFINYCNNLCNNTQCLCNCINNNNIISNNNYNYDNSIIIGKIMLCILLFAIFIKCFCFTKSKNTTYHINNDDIDINNNTHNTHNTKKNNNITDITDNTINIQSIVNSQNPPSYDSIIIDLD